MNNFLRAARRPPREVLEIVGTKIEVRGLTYGEINKISKPRLGEKARDLEALARELIIACCYTTDGKKLIPDDEDFSDWSPAVVRELGEAVARVNGSPSGNSSATGGEDSVSA